MPANTDKIPKTGMSQIKTSNVEQLPHQIHTLKPKDMRKQLFSLSTSSQAVNMFLKCAMLLVTSEIHLNQFNYFHFFLTISNLSTEGFLI